MRYLMHIPKTGGTSLLISGIPGGHHIDYEESKKYFVIIRNPINRTISHFSEQRKSNETLRDWFKEEYWNFQTKWLLKHLKVNNLNEIKNILKKNFVVLTTDKLTTQMKKFGYNIPQVNMSKRIGIDDKYKELILSKNQQDIKLYEFAQRVTTI